MLCWDFRILPGILLQWFCSVSYLRPAASVDVHADGTVGAAAAHEEMSPVVGLHHSDEVPTAVLEKQAQKKKRNNNMKSGRGASLKPLGNKTWFGRICGRGLSDVQSGVIWEFICDTTTSGSQVRKHFLQHFYISFIMVLWTVQSVTEAADGTARLSGTNPQGLSGKGRKLIGWTLLACWQQTSCVCAFVSLNSTHFCLPVGCQRVWKSESDGTFSRWMGWNLRNPHNKMVWALLLFLFGVWSKP